jgi:co-chaperonin GroES (HSP10)
MKAKGNNLLIRPEKRDTVLPSGIILPSTAKESDKEWGIIIDGAEKLIDSYGNHAENGMRVYYFSKNFEKDGIKLVQNKKCLLWKQAQE